MPIGNAGRGNPEVVCTNRRSARLELRPHFGMHQCGGWVNGQYGEFLPDEANERRSSGLHGWLLGAVQAVHQLA